MKIIIQNITLFLSILFELIALTFVIVFWRELQQSFYISEENVVAHALFGIPLLLGFLRALIICSIPLIVLLLFALALKMLYSIKGKFGPLEFEEATENLTQVDMIQRNLDNAVSELKEIRSENERLKEFNKVLAEQLVTIVKKEK